MLDRITKWLFIYICIGLIPVAFSRMVNIFSMGIYGREYSIDILFFILVICASTLDDTSVIHPKYPKCIILNRISILFIIGILLIYSLKFFEEITQGQMLLDISLFNNFVIIYAVINSLWGLSVQVFIGKIEESEKMKILKELKELEEFRAKSVEKTG